MDADEYSEIVEWVFNTSTLHPKDAIKVLRALPITFTTIDVRSSYLPAIDDKDEYLTLVTPESRSHERAVRIICEKVFVKPLRSTAVEFLAKLGRKGSR